MALAWRPAEAALPLRAAGPGVGWVESRLRAALGGGGPVCLVGPTRPALALAQAAWPSSDRPRFVSLEGAQGSPDLRVIVGQALGRWPAGGARAWEPHETDSALLVDLASAPLAPTAALLSAWGCRAVIVLDAGQDCGTLERVALPESAAEEQTESQRSFDPLAQADARAGWLAVAEGGAWPTLPAWSDARDLEALGRLHPKVEQRARARAVAARLWSAWGEDGRVDFILEATDPETLPPIARGWLAWAAADHRFRWGRDGGDALATAADAFRQGRALRALAALRRWEAVQRLSQRQPLRAARAAAEARALSQGKGDRQGVGRALAISGELALCTGEHLSAEVLLDQARQGLPPGPARRALDLSQLRAEIARGTLPATPLPPTADVDAPIAGRAARALVCADLALRRGELVEATRLAAEAEEAWALLGEPSSAALAARIRGDAAARTGQIAVGLACWRRALRVQLDRHDADAAAISADRLVLLLAASGDEAGAEALGASLSPLSRRSPR